MGGFVRRVVRLLLRLAILSWIGAAIGAVVAKSKLRSAGGPSDDEVDLVAIFEPIRFTSLALFWFGGGDIDLRGATLDPAGATLTIRAIFGGGRILVPESWRVELRVFSILGGAADTRATADRPADAPTLVVDGCAFMGGFAIFSEAPGGWS